MGSSRKLGEAFELLVGLVLIFALLGGVVLAAHHSSKASFDRLSRVRQMDRIPLGSTGAAVPGEVQVEGQASAVDGLVTAPESGTATLHYTYVIEVKDSDNDWVVESRSRMGAPFLLDDGSGPIRVEASEATAVRLTRNYRAVRDGKRHSEWRLDPGDRVTAVGFAEPRGDTTILRFDIAGAYHPLLTQLGAAAEQRRLATQSVLLLWLGLVCLSLLILFLTWICHIHRTAIFLLLASVVVAGTLGYHGLRMMRSDLDSGFASLERRMEIVGLWLSRELAAHGLTRPDHWKRISDAELAAVPEESARRIRSMRVDLARAIDRMNAARDAFPERLLAGLWGFEPLETIPLSEADREMTSAMEEARTRATVHPAAGWLVGLGALVLSILSAWVGLRWIREKRYLEYIPTSPTTAVSYGLTELKGTFEPVPGQQPLTAPDSGAACVFYRYLVERRRDKSWSRVSDDRKHIPFVVRDRQGTIPVKIRGARIETRHRERRVEGGRRYTEWRIEVGDPAYVFGSARPDRDGDDRLVVMRGDEGLPFLVSNKSEREIMGKRAFGAFVCFTLSLNLATGALLFGLGLFGLFNPATYLLAALIGPVYLLICLGVLVRDGLSFMRNRVSRAWSNIDVALRKRGDMIARLESVVSSYLSDQPEATTRLAALRTWARISKSRPEDVAEAISHEGPFLEILLAHREACPEMQEDWGAVRVVAEFGSLAGDLALMRDGYNDAVAAYNRRVRSLLEGLLARLGGFRPAPPIPAPKPPPR